MRYLLKWTLACVLIAQLCCVAAALPQDVVQLTGAPHMVTIKVVDHDGYAVPHATVSLYSGGYEKAIGNTGPDGTLEVTLTTGEYRFRIIARGFQSELETVNVFADAMKKQIIFFSLSDGDECTGLACSMTIHTHLVRPDANSVVASRQVNLVEIKGGRSGQQTNS